MRPVSFALLLGSAALVSTAAFGQSATVIDLRVGKLEKEMKAVQRKVFPQGVPIEPEIGAAAPTVSGNAASAPIADLTARVDALEAQLKMLTGQSEQDGFRIRKLEDMMKAMREEMDARLKAIEGGATPASTTIEPAAPKAPQIVSATRITTPETAAAQPTAAAVRPAAQPSAAVVRPAKPAPAPGAVTAKPATPGPAKVDPARKALLAAVEVPDTGDAAEDAYTYGFRLWSAKLYPEAQVKFKEFATKYPKHKRASYAQNLLGRAYLDEGKPALASVAFYDNYQKNPRGDRAAESLYWLGAALMKLKKPADACKVYVEFAEVYGATAPADLRAKVAKGRADAKCAS